MERSLGHRAQPAADPEPLSGVATLMCKEEDWTIFRRFDVLNLLNLLILQDELQDLTAHLRELNSTTPGFDAAAEANMWYVMATRKDTTAQEQKNKRLESERRATWRRIKEKLREYSETLSPLLHPD